MAGLKVLIVDDARFIRDLVSKIVSSGFPDSEVKAAEDGEAGRKMMMQHQFDIILCDWEMPGLSGLEVLQWARQQPNYQNYSQPNYQQPNYQQPNYQNYSQPNYNNQNYGNQNYLQRRPLCTRYDPA